MPQIPAGPFTLSQAGWTPKTLRIVLRRGDVRRLVQGVYVAVEAKDSIELRARALQLVVPPRAVGCRTTAAWLDGVDALADDIRFKDPPLEMAVTEDTATVRRPGVRCYVEMLAPEDIEVVGGVRVTTPLRTAADLSRWLPRYFAIGALDAYLRSELVTRDQLLAETDRWFGFSGVKQLRELVRFADPRAESPRESWLRLFIHDAGFPDATPQVPIDRGPGLEPYRLDLGIEDLMVGFDYDGRAYHPEDDPRDARRRAYIRSQGWTLIVVRRGDLERPQRLVDAIGQFVTPVRSPRKGMGVITGFAPPPFREVIPA